MNVKGHAIALNLVKRRNALITVLEYKEHNYSREVVKYRYT